MVSAAVLAPIQSAQIMKRMRYIFSGSNSANGPQETYPFLHHIEICETEVMKSRVDGRQAAPWATTSVTIPKLEKEQALFRVW